MTLSECDGSLIKDPAGTNGYFVQKSLPNQMSNKYSFWIWSKLGLVYHCTYVASKVVCALLCWIVFIPLGCSAVMHVCTRSDVYDTPTSHDKMCVPAVSDIRPFKLQSTLRNNLIERGYMLFPCDHLYFMVNYNLSEAVNIKIINIWYWYV